MKTPITKRILKQHLTYHWWAYLVLAAAVGFAWSIIFTTTAYRSPENLRVDFYLYGGTSQALVDEYMEHIRTTEMSDMETMSSILMTNDNVYGSVQLTTYVYAKEGDVYLVSSSDFQSFAALGAFLPLEEETELIARAEAAGCVVERGWRLCTELNERHLYGIPASTLTGMKSLGIRNDDMYLCVLASCGNNENAVKFMTCLIRDMAPAAATPSDLN